MKKYKKKITLSGTALLATIATMESLGPIGLEVLQKYKIKKVEKHKQYPIEIRNAIFSAVLKKYGEVALLDMGYKNADFIFEMFTDVINFSAKEEKGLKSKNVVKSSSSLDKVLKFYVKKANNFIKSVTTGNNVDYGAKIKNIRKFEYIYSITMALQANAEAFMKGTQVSNLILIFGKYFVFDFINLKEKTISGYGFSTCQWLIKFTPKFSNVNSYQILNEKKIEVNKLLMKTVLEDAFEQNKKIENISKKIAKYIPPQINNALFEGNYDTKIETKRKKLTIFFSDIKNFTSISENLQPEDLTKYLNEYFSEMTSIALKYGGTIDKYIGDAMMIFFGDPTSNGEKEDARTCVNMAMAMQEKMSSLQLKWKNEGFSNPFEVRIGINTGYCNVGNFGSEQRLTYTIIGGEVNVTQRLEGNSDPNGILMSYETYAHVQDIVEVEERQKIKMKGINREVKCFAVKKKKLNRKILKDKKKMKNILNNSDIVKIDNFEERILKLEKNIQIIVKKLSKLEL